MKNQLLLLFMSAFGIGLALTPITSGLDPRLVKGAAWFLRGIFLRVLK